MNKYFYTLLFLIFSFIHGYSSSKHVLEIETIKNSGQVEIILIKNSADLKPCSQPGSFTLRLTNLEETELTNISRRIVYPNGYTIIPATNLPQGISLNTAGNLLDISIPLLESEQVVEFDFTLEASCSVPSSAELKPVIESVPGVTDNNTYIQNAGNIAGINVLADASSLTFDENYSKVNGINTTNWSYTSFRGDVFTRSYRIVNTGSEVFNGYLNYSNSFPSTFKIVDVTVEFTNGSEPVVISQTPEEGTSEFYSEVFEINGLASQSGIIITERIEVIECLNASNSECTVSFNYSCISNETCQLIASKNIGVFPQPGRPNIQAVETTVLPQCVIGNSFQREVVFTNVGEGAAISPVLNFHADVYANAWLAQFSSTVVPVQTCTLSIFSPNGELLKTYVGSELERLKHPYSSWQTAIYPNNVYPYPKCSQSQEVFIGLNNFLLEDALKAGEYVVLRWTEIHCCPETPSLTSPDDWKGILYQTVVANMFFTEDCGTGLISSNTIPDVELSNRVQSLSITQSFLPFVSRLSGVDRVYANNHPGDPSVAFSGETSNVTIQTQTVKTTSIKLDSEHAVLELRLALDDGLTLLKADFIDDVYVLTGGEYPVTLRNNATILNPVSVQLTSEKTNQDVDDGIRETYTLLFNIKDLESFGSRLTLSEKLVDFLEESEINFTVRAVCTGNAFSNFDVSLFLRPGSVDGLSCNCSMPITTIRAKNDITCPGCITPGVVMQGVKFQRTTMGEIDNDDNGIADILEGKSIPGDKRVANFTTLGDQFVTREFISFVDGDPQLGGFNYSQLVADESTATIDVNGDGIADGSSGVTLDELYVTLDVVDAIRLDNSNFNFVALPYTTSTEDGTQGRVLYVFHVSASELGLTDFNPNTTSPIELINEFTIVKNIYGTTLPYELIYVGYLTDKNLNIATLEQWQGFENGSCNDREIGFDCSGYLQTVRTSGKSYNHYCEPSNSVSFLYIPAILNNNLFVDNTNNVDLCEERINYYAQYNHEKRNSFPYEARNYGTTLDFSANIPDGYKLTKIGILNRAQYTTGTATENILLTPEDSRWNQWVSITPDPNGKGEKAVLTLEMVALGTPNSNNFVHYGDEALELSVNFVLEPIECGVNSQNYYFASTVTPPGDSISRYELAKYGTNVYPFMDFNYVDFNFTIPDWDREAYFFRPFTDLRLGFSGAANQSIGDIEASYSIRLENHFVPIAPFITDPVINYPNNKSIKTKNTFLLFNIPSDAGFEVTRLIVGSSTITPYNNIPNYFKIDDINSGQFISLDFFVAYSCNQPLNEYPIEILYGYDCGDFPTIEDVLNNNVCFRDLKIFKLTSDKLNLQVNTIQENTPSDVCGTFDYNATISSIENGYYEDFSIVVELPPGISYDPNEQASLLLPDGHTSILLGSPARDENNSMLVWDGIYNDKLNLGKSINFKTKFKTGCATTEYGTIKTTVKAYNYCGNEALVVTELQPQVQVSESNFDNINFNITCSPQDLTVSYEITNTTLRDNELKVTIPEGLVFVSADGNYTKTGQIVSWEIPKGSTGTGSYTINVDPSPSLVLCGSDNLVSFAELVLNAEILCGEEICTPSKQVVKACTTAVSPISITLEADPILCPGGCTDITAVFNPSVSYDIVWTSLEIPGFTTTGEKINVCPNMPTTYVATFIEGQCSISKSIVVAPATGCANKQITDCTRRIFIALNDVVQESVTPITCSSAPGAPSIKLNGIYRLNTRPDLVTNFPLHYKNIGLPLDCNYLIPGDGYNNLQKPEATDFVPGTEDPSLYSQRIFAVNVGTLWWHEAGFFVDWSGPGSSFANLGTCPPDNKFTPGIENQVYYIYFMVPAEGKFEEAYAGGYDNPFETVILKQDIESIGIPWVDIEGCSSQVPSNYEYLLKNLKVELKLKNSNDPIVAYVKTLNQGDGGPILKVKEEKDNSCYHVCNLFVSASSDKTICYGEQVQLNVLVNGHSGNVSYSWSSPGDLDNPTSPNPIASPVSTTQYIVTVTDDNNCSKSDVVNVTVSNWSNLTGVVGRSVSTIYPYQNKLLIGGDLQSVNGKYGVNVALWDGQSYSRVMEPMNTRGYPSMFKEYNGKLYAAGNFHVDGNDGIAVWEGGKWNNVGGTSRAQGLEEYNGELYMASSDYWTKRIAKYDGSTVTILTDLPVVIKSHALKTFNGSLYAHGVDDYVYSYNGSTWESVGQPLSGIINKFYVYNNKLYAAGNFPGGLARLENSGWVIVDEVGIAGNVKDLIEYNGTLIVGGNFTKAGSITVSNIVKFNGTNFESFGDGFGGEGINDLEIFNGRLIAGGTFYSVDGAPIYNIAQYCEDINPFTENIAADVSLGRKVSLYPNPTTHESTIDFNGNFSNMVDIEVTSLNGMEVEIHKNVSVKDTISIGKSLPNGVYIIKISDSNEVQILRLVKTR